MENKQEYQEEQNIAEKLNNQNNNEENHQENNEENNENLQIDKDEEIKQDKPLSENANEGDNDLEQYQNYNGQSDEEEQIGIEDQVEQSEESDKRSIYVKNVDYMTTKDELFEHFNCCGKINRVTIVTDKFTQHPKGYAYIEFAEIDGVENSKNLNESLLRGRQIKVLAKRTNVPYKGGRRAFRRGRGRSFRGGYYARGPYMFSGHRRRGGRFIPY